MIQIRPVSDLRNKFPDIEKAVGGGPGGSDLSDGPHGVSGVGEM